LDKCKESIGKKLVNHKEIQNKIDINVVKSLLGNGFKQIEIARKLNASKGTISNIVKKINTAP
jgi:DNA-binding NarL/FixJ family response regulator